MSKRLTEAQKRRRRYARQDGKYAARCIARAIEYQQHVAWHAARPSVADLAKTWQQMSDRALESAASNARDAAHWANLSKENL